MVSPNIIPSSNAGDYAAGDTVYATFNSQDLSTGNLTALTGSAVVTIYKDGSTSGITTGVTLTTNFAGFTGSNFVSIDTSQSSGFYVSGHTFVGILSAGSIGAGSAIGFHVLRFTLRLGAISSGAISGIPKTTGNGNSDAYDRIAVTNLTESAAVPAATDTLLNKLNYVSTMHRNKITNTASQQKVYANDGSTVVGTSSVSDDGTTATRGAFA